MSKHKNFETRAELLRAAADSIEMQEKAGALPECKIKGIIWYIVDTSFGEKPNIYEFPLAVVEDKQVWEGDELYGRDGKKLNWDFFKGATHVIDFGVFSWNPPKPKTVMVELPYEDVVLWSRNAPIVPPCLAEACRKALKGLKCQK